MHKYSAPHVQEDSARRALASGLELQVVAAQLAEVHRRQYLRSRRRRRARRAVTALLLLAGLVAVSVLAPVGTWWNDLGSTVAQLSGR